jgi:hypothetical protein
VRTCSDHAGRAGLLFDVADSLTTLTCRKRRPQVHLTINTPEVTAVSGR